MYKNGLFLVAFLTFLLGAAAKSIADQQPFNGDTKRYQVGKKIYSDYCARCHGENADGRGKAASLYIRMKAARPSNFKVKFFSIRPKQYLTKIVRDGGKQHSLSEYMPPFGDELNNQQIDDVVYFIQNVSLYDLDKSAADETHSYGKVATGQN